MLGVAYAECHFSECPYARCHYAKFDGTNTTPSELSFSDHCMEHLSYVSLLILSFKKQAPVVMEQVLGLYL
jgi:hypothetical protein